MCERAEVHEGTAAVNQAARLAARCNCKPNNAKHVCNDKSTCSLLTEPAARASNIQNWARWGIWKHLLFSYRIQVFWAVTRCLQVSGSDVSKEFYVLLTVHLGIILVNNQLDAQFFFMYVHFYSLHVSGSHVPIIRRINCNNTSGICHCV